MNSTIPPLLLYSIYDCHSGQRHSNQYLLHCGSVMASPSSQTTAVLYSSVLEPLTVLTVLQSPTFSATEAGAQFNDRLANCKQRQTAKKSRFKWSLVTVWGLFCFCVSRLLSSRIPISRNDSELLDCSRDGSI